MTAWRPQFNRSGVIRGDPRLSPGRFLTVLGIFWRGVSQSIGGVVELQVCERAVCGTAGGERGMVLRCRGIIEPPFGVMPWFVR